MCDGLKPNSPRNTLRVSADLEHCSTTLVDLENFMIAAVWKIVRSGRMRRCFKVEGS